MAVLVGERMDPVVSLGGHSEGEAGPVAGTNPAGALVEHCRAALAGVLSPPERILAVLLQLRDHLGADRAAVLMLDDDSRLRIIAALGLEEAERAPCLEIGEGLSGFVAQSGEALLVRCVERDDRFRHRRHEKYFRGSLISAPLFHGTAVRGAMSICRSRDAFCGSDLDLLEQVASNTAPVAAQALE